ncbi:MAG TPA: peptidyl-prolyl cis-trans isomerase [Terriglobia bacterium]|nr:peptidyl-prolyl cis-trans isomerase [Terriglobia bacterium]
MSQRVRHLLSAFAVLCIVSSPAAASRQIIERIIARVNNEIVTMHQFESQRDKLREQLGQQYSGAELEDQFKEQSKNLLRDLIDQDLMVEKAKDLNINADTDVVKRLDQIRAQMNLATINDLEKEVEKQGIIWEDFQDNIRRNLLMQRVIEREVGSRIIITDADGRKYFESHQKEFDSPGGVRLAEILVATDKHPPTQAQKLADEALAAIKAGGKWEDLVKKYSDDSSAQNGGDVGFFKDGTLLPAISSAVQHLDVNETSGIIHTKYGYMIAKVLERRSPGAPKFEEVRTDVENVLYQKQMQPALRDYLYNLRKESYIFLAPGYIDTGSEPSNQTEVAQTRK